jgi:hypothetical protein
VTNPVHDYRLSFSELARLAVQGRPADVALYLSRLARRLRGDDAEMADTLTALIRQGGGRSALRREAGVPVPVDAESRLHLVRIERPSLQEASPILQPTVKRLVEGIVRERRMAAELEAAGLSPSKSALFVGPPGVGKTLSARWIAAALDLPLLILDLSAVMSSFLGKTGNNLRAVLDYAKRQDCVLLLDELDAIAKRRDDSTEIGELKRLVTVLLQEIDEWPSTGILLAASNHGDLLDPAVWRRFDVLIEFPTPEISEVRDATARFLGDDLALVAPWYDLITASFVGKSFSDIERSITGARRRALVEGRGIDEELAEQMQSWIDSRDHGGKLSVAAHLNDIPGVSQRRIADLTGLSRDTLRRHQFVGNKQKLT